MRKSLWSNLLTMAGLSVSSYKHWQAFSGGISIICLSKWLVIFPTSWWPWLEREKEAHLKPSLHCGNLPRVTLTNIGHDQESQSKKNKISQQNIWDSRVDVTRCSINFIYLYPTYLKKCVRARLDRSHVKSLRTPFRIHLHELCM